MPFSLDIRTLSFTSGIIALFLALCMYYFRKTQKTYPGFNEWIAAALFNCGGMLLLSFRAYLPDFVTIIVANTCLVIFEVLLLIGFLKFVDANFNTLQLIIPLAIYTGLFLFFTYGIPHVAARIVTISLIFSIISGHCVYLGITFLKKELGFQNWLLVITFAFKTIWFLARSVLTLLFEFTITDFMSSGFIQEVSFIIYCLGNILIILNFIIMTAQKLSSDLIYAMKEIKNLESLLPICAKCKKIRNPEGRWEEIESYISTRTDTQFSHGLCDKCSDDLYGDQDWYKKIKK